MTSFATSDYNFLIKSLVQGSLQFKTQSLKRLTILATNDKKQFVNNVKKILINFEDVIIQPKESIHVLATILLLQIIPGFVSKEIEQLLKNKIFKHLIKNLGDLENSNLRKISHSCLLAYIKTYHNFDVLQNLYLKEGILSNSPQLQQKCINSFQSIFIMQGKYLDWSSYDFKMMFQTLIKKLQDQNPFVKKAANQCLVSICKISNVKLVIQNLTIQHLILLKKFVSQQIVSSQLDIQFIQRCIKLKTSIIPKRMNQLTIKAKQITNIEPLVKQINYNKNKQQVIINQKKKVQQKKQKYGNTNVESNYQKKEVHYLTQTQKMQNLFNKKLIQCLKNQDNWKQRIQAAEEVLLKIDLNKDKPEISSFLKLVLPPVIKLIIDNNSKISLLGLRIFQHMIDSPEFEFDQQLYRILCQKLSDSKTSIRQTIAKIIKNLFQKTNKDKWIDTFLIYLSHNPNPFLKDQIFTMLHHIYSQSSQQITYDSQKIVISLAPFMQDVKTKIKIKTLQLLAIISLKSNKIAIISKKLESLLSAVFYEMFLQKISKSKISGQKKHKIRFTNSETISAKPGTSPQRTIHLEQGKKLRIQQLNLDKSKSQKLKDKKVIIKSYTPTNLSQTDKSINKLIKSRQGSQGLNTSKKDFNTLDINDLKLNQSIQVAKKGLLNIHRKNRKISANKEFQQTSTTRKNGIIKNINQYNQLFLPSLRKNRDNSLQKSIQQIRNIQVGLQSKYENMNSDYKALYLQKQDLKPLIDAQKQYKNIINQLKDPDWERQFQALNKLRRIIQHSDQALSYGGSTHLHLIIVQLLKLVENLRSSVAKNALICLGQLIQKMKKFLDGQIQIIIQKLLKKTSDSNIFINIEIKKCLCILSVNMTQSKVIQNIAKFKQSKNLPIKQNIIIMLTKMITNSKIIKKQFQKIIQLLVYFLAEPNLQLRSKSKNAIIQFCKSLHDWQRILRNSVSNQIYKNVLEVYTKNQLKSNSTLIISQRNSSTRQKSQLKNTPISQRKIYQKSVEQKKQNQQQIKKSNRNLILPEEFSLLDEYYQGTKHQQWKKRIENLKNIIQLINKYPNEFNQYRNNVKLIDIISNRIGEHNIKVSLYCIKMVAQNFEILKTIIENNLSIISNSVFNNLSSTKNEIKQESEKLYQIFYNSIDINLLLQHICHGCLYSLTKSRIFLLIKVSKYVKNIYQTKNILFTKYIIPMLNKCLQQNKTQIIPYVNQIIKQIYVFMGQQMFNLFTKSNLLRDMLSRI